MVKSTAATIFFTLIMLIGVRVFVAGNYVLEVHVMSYSNPSNGCQAFSGRCCDEGHQIPCAGNRRCETYFRFCLRPLDTLGTVRTCSTTVLRSTSVANGAAINFLLPTFLELDNPLSLPGLGTAWQGAQLYVETIDRDGGLGGNDDDFIDSFNMDIDPQQPVGISVSSNAPGGIIPGVHGYGMIGLTARVVCAEDYYGDRCEFLDEIDQCQANGIVINECNLQGTCVDGTLNYTCDCYPGYTGRDCELVDYCIGITCNNRGMCQNEADTYTCECLSGFTGTNCEFDDHCLGINCGNGSCLNMFTTYTCDCDPGFTGSNCEININDCEDEDCDEHGTCQDLIDDFRCVCDPGYTGRVCDTDINECDEQDCNDNGQCVNLVGSFTCNCNPGYTGDFCEINIDDCVGVNCSGNGQCMDGENEYSCLCDPGFAGDLCSLAIDSSASVGGAVGGVLGAVVVIVLVVLLVLLIVMLVLKRTKRKTMEVTQTTLQFAPGDNPVYGIPENNHTSGVPPANTRVGTVTTIGSDLAAEFDNPIYGDNGFEQHDYEAPPTTNVAAEYADVGPVYAEAGNGNVNERMTNHYDFGPDAEQLYQNVNT